MELIETVTEAVSMLTVNKLRTTLAVLGIVIGIGSVITLMSIGQSSQKSIESQIESIGANLLTVSPAGQTTRGVRGASGGGTTLTYEDSQAIAQSPLVTTVAQVSPVYAERSQVVAGKNNANTQISGVTPNYAAVRKLSMASGTFITESNVATLANVAVLGPQTAEDLFGEAVDPLGQIIKVSGQNFSIIGITAAKGGSGPMNQDDAIYIPLTTAQKKIFGVKHITSLYIEAKSKDEMIKAQNQVGYLLLDRHKLTDPSEADFSIFSQQDILSAASSVSGTLTTLLTGVAAISLLVGGIGIMNIMLVTVTERTREIGLRKALGAHKKHITTQFLTESVILTLAGGLLGIVIGTLITYVYAQYSQSAFLLSTQAIILACLVSGSIGILFGWYPAQRAAQLQPIEALRYE